MPTYINGFDVQLEKKHDAAKLCKRLNEAGTTENEVLQAVMATLEVTSSTWNYNDGDQPTLQIRYDSDRMHDDVERDFMFSEDAEISKLRGWLDWVVKGEISTGPCILLSGTPDAEPLP